MLFFFGRVSRRKTQVSKRWAHTCGSSCPGWRSGWVWAGSFAQSLLHCTGSLWLPPCDCAGRRATRERFLFLCHKHCVCFHTPFPGLEVWISVTRVWHRPVAPLTWNFSGVRHTQSHGLWIPSLHLCSPHLKYSKLLHFLILSYVF